MTIEQLLNKYKKAYPTAFISEGGISILKGERAILIHGCRAAATLYFASQEATVEAEPIDIPLEETPLIEAEPIDIPLEETPSIKSETPVVASQEATTDTESIDIPLEETPLIESEATVVATKTKPKTKKVV